MATMTRAYANGRLRMTFWDSYSSPTNAKFHEVTPEGIKRITEEEFNTKLKAYRAENEQAVKNLK